VLGQLLEHVGQAFVVEGRGHLEAALLTEILQRVGQVGGA
jgi:hypothetical protein